MCWTRSTPGICISRIEDSLFIGVDHLVVLRVWGDVLTTDVKKSDSIVGILVCWFMNNVCFGF